MAAYLITRKTGEAMAARWVSGHVKIAFNGAAEVEAFALAGESALYLDEEADGTLVIVYLAAGVVTMRRTRDRVNWS